MLLAVVLQVVGAACVVAACVVLFGAAVGLFMCGLIVFAAGYAHERSAGS